MSVSVVAFVLTVCSFNQAEEDEDEEAGDSEDTCHHCFLRLMRDSLQLARKDLYGPHMPSVTRPAPLTEA